MKKTLFALSAFIFAFAASAQGSDAATGKQLFDSEHYAKALPYIKKAAAAGDIDSQVRLAYMTFTGNEVEMDREAAYEMLDKCIAKGSAYAMSQRAIFMLMDARNDQERAQAVDWFKKAADAGDADAAVYMVNCLRNERNNNMSSAEEAVKYCRAAAKAGHMEGMAWMGVYTFRGDGGVIKNESEGIQLIEQAYAKSKKNSFEKNCYEAAKILQDFYSKNGETAKANAIRIAIKKYHPEKL